MRAKPRNAHYLKKNHSNERPQHMVFVDTETNMNDPTKKENRYKLHFGWACYVRRRGPGRYSEPKWIRFETRWKFWDWVDRLPRPGTKLYIFAHNWGFDALVLGMFKELPRRGWKAGLMVLEGPPVIIDWKREKQKIRILDTLNWWRSSLAVIGDELGIPKLDMPTESASRAEWDRYCKRDVEVLVERIKTWLDFLDDQDLGVFAPTLASQAWNAWRHRFLHDDILIDNDQRALDLAREGYVGARTEAYFIGRVEGPVYELDVNAMYPAVMASEEYPARLVMYSENVTLEELTRLTETHCVMARVLIDTDQPIYPAKRKKRLLFPTGKIRVTLATPELVIALRLGHVKAVEAVAVYEKARIFESFVKWGWDTRMQARREGRKVDDYAAKITLNALAGKLGQRGRHWQTIGQADPDTVEVVKILDADTKEVKQYRRVGGTLQELLTDGESRDSHPAIAAHVLSYARVVIWDLQVEGGRVNTYYSDTDCLWCNQIAYDLLKHRVDPTGLGALKLEDTHEWAKFNTLKDYEWPEGRKTKGVKAKAHELNEEEIREYLIEKGEDPELAPSLVGNVYSQEQWRGLKGAIRAGDLDTPLTTTVTKRLTRNYTKGKVLGSGRVEPFRLEEW